MRLANSFRRTRNGALLIEVIYRSLNAVASSDSYLLLRMGEGIVFHRNLKILSPLDTNSYYSQNKVHKTVKRQRSSCFTAVLNLQECYLSYIVAPVRFKALDT